MNPNDKETLKIKKKAQEISDEELNKVAGGGNNCDAGASWRSC